MFPQVPDYIRTLTPYIPGKPIEETKREYGVKRAIKLASNENPLGPSPKALEALRSQLRDLHRYPDGSGYRLKQALSQHLKIPSSSLVLGNGSNEVIDQLIRTYCIPGDAIVTRQAAFIAYQVCAQVHGVKTLEAKISEDQLEVDLNEVLQLAKADPRVKLVFLANPNNPTGTYLRSEALRGFLKELSQIRSGSVLPILDYAYWEYVTAKDLPDPLELFNEFPQVIVLRTFSKVYGLAGLRLGYGIASSEVIAHLDKVRHPFNINSLALAGAEAALSDRAFVRESRKVNEQGMKFWAKGLGQLGIPFWKSQGNFFLANVQKGLGMSGSAVQEAVLKKGLILRPVANYKLPHAIRISIGTPAENKRALEVLASLCPSEVKKSEKRKKK